MFNRIKTLILISLVLFASVSSIAVGNLKNEKKAEAETEVTKNKLESKTSNLITANVQLKTESQMQREKRVNFLCKNLGI
jgi:hypothetical protein